MIGKEEREGEGEEGEGRGEGEEGGKMELPLSVSWHYGSHVCRDSRI